MLVTQVPQAIAIQVLLSIALLLTQRALLVTSVCICAESLVRAVLLLMLLYSGLDWGTDGGFLFLAILF